MLPHVWEYGANGDQNDEPAATIILIPLTNAQRYHKHGSAARWTTADSVPTTTRHMVEGVRHLRTNLILLHAEQK